MIGYLFTSAGVVLLAVFVYPAFWTLIKALYRSFNPSDFVATFRDPLVWRSAKNTLLWTVIEMPLAVLYPLAIALLLHRERHLQAFFRAGYYLPTAISGGIWATLWMWVWNPDLGLLNGIFMRLGLPWKQRWAFDGRMLVPALSTLGIIVPGLAVLLFLTGLNSIPEEVHEAASLDGAGGWRTFFAITLPFLRPVLLLVILPAVLANLQIFQPMEVITGGWPLEWRRTYLMYAPAHWFVMMGFLWLLIGVLTIVLFRLLRVEKN